MLRKFKVISMALKTIHNQSQAFTKALSPFILVQKLCVPLIHNYLPLPRCMNLVPSQILLFAWIIFPCLSNVSHSSKLRFRKPEVLLTNCTFPEDRNSTTSAFKFWLDFCIIMKLNYILKDKRGICVYYSQDWGQKLLIILCIPQNTSCSRC